MSSMPLFCSTGTLILATMLVGCGGGQESSPLLEAESESIESADDRALAPVAGMHASAEDELVHVTSAMRRLSSDQAPFACDLLLEEQVGEVLGEEAQSFDITTSRQNTGPVESSCLFAYGPDKNPESIGAGALFVRVDVYSDRSYRSKGWGDLNEQWIYRTQDNIRRFDFYPGVWAAWVDSDHPPDPALLIRSGDVMFEVAYYPPSSSPGSTQANGKIEKIATLLLEKVDSMYPPK